VAQKLNAISFGPVAELASKSTYGERGERWAAEQPRERGWRRGGGGTAQTVGDGRRQRPEQEQLARDK